MKNIYQFWKSVYSVYNNRAIDYQFMKKFTRLGREFPLVHKQTSFQLDITMRAVCISVRNVQQHDIQTVRLYSTHMYSEALCVGTSV